MKCVIKKVRVRAENRDGHRTVNTQCCFGLIIN